MVTDTRKALRPRTLKPLNVPVAVAVDEDKSGRPATLIDPKRDTVIDIEDIWRLDDEWWRAEALSRIYYTITTSSGRRLTIFKDLATGNWYHH